MADHSGQPSSPPLGGQKSAAHSLDSCHTHVELENNKEFNQLERTFSPGHGESALPEDKREEAFENLEDDWENDPENARNWTSRRKWTAVAIVSV